MYFVVHRYVNRVRSRQLLDAKSRKERHHRARKLKQDEQRMKVALRKKTAHKNLQNRIRTVAKEERIEAELHREQKKYRMKQILAKRLKVNSKDKLTPDSSTTTATNLDSSRREFKSNQCETVSKSHTRRRL